MHSSPPNGPAAPDRSETELGSRPRIVPGPTGGGRDDSGSFSAGELLAGRFEILRWIASGAMGDVYEAHDLELGERVAVKTIRQEIASDQQAMERFRREISLARKVTHPGVCRIFDVFFHDAGEATEARDKVAFLTMELLEGVTLSAHLRDAGPLSTAEAGPLVRQMAAALAAAHEAGVVHRDFKSSNVMLAGGSRGLRVVVTDFGLARRAEIEGGDGEVTAAGEILGSPAFMAPEQATGGEITPATDVYSLGVVMYQMVTGRLPFEAASPVATLLMRIRQDPPPPSRHVPLDPRWEATIMKCLERDPSRRFDDASRLLADIEPAERRRHLSKRLRRRLRWAEGSLALVLVIAGVAYLPTLRRATETGPAVTTASEAPSSSRRSVAVLGFKNLSDRQDVAWLATALTEMLATELAAGEGLRTVPGENVARMKIELAVRETDGLAADTLAAIGKHLNTDVVVLGSYLATGAGAANRLRLDLRAQDTATGETIATLSETGTEAGLLGLICRLGADLRQDLGVDPTPEEHPVVEGAALPANPVAARRYAQGLAELRNFRALAARDLLEQAISADPEYALAYAALAETLTTLGYDSEAMDQISVAFELATRLPMRERLSIEGRYREMTGDWDRAIQIYQTLVEAYPDSLEHRLDLVRAQTRGERPRAAEATLESLRRLPSPAADDPRIDLGEADLAWSLGQFSRALEASARAADKGRRLGARLLVGRARRHESRALWRLGRLDDAVAAAGEAERALLELGDRAGGAEALTLSGILLHELGELHEAASAYERALAIFRDVGNREGIDRVLDHRTTLLQALEQPGGEAELN